MTASQASPLERPAHALAFAEATSVGPTMGGVKQSCSEHVQNVMVGAAGRAQMVFVPLVLPSPWLKQRELAKDERYVTLTFKAFI